MSTASMMLISYFAGGALLLALFDIMTGRIRTRLLNKAAQTQLVMAQHGNMYFGKRAAIILFMATMWLFWPAVLIGALTEGKGGDNEQEGENEEERQGEEAAEEPGEKTPEK